MAKKRERAFALIAAVTFLLSSIAFSVLVVWSMIQDSKTKDQEVSTVDNSANTQALAGTKLANYTPVDKVDSLEKIDLVEGTGEAVKEGATVTVHYTGALAKTGVIFESSKDSGQTATFGLDQVIAGWTQGIPGMKVGGTRRLMIPAELAYGEQSPSPDIPANSDLVFDVELIAVE